MFFYVRGLGSGELIKAKKIPQTVFFYVRGHFEISVLEIISIFHGCMVWIEKSVTRVTDQHHEACRVMPNSDPE